MITGHLHEDLLLIARLYVLPDFQRQGIGKLLIEASCRAFPQARQVRLEVEEQNSKGRNFYSRMGFREVDVKRDELADTKTNFVVLEKAIDKRK